MPFVELTERRFWTRKRKRVWFRNLAILGVVTVAGVLAWPRVMNRYDRWTAHRHAKMAAEAFARGDFRHAIISAKSALTSNQRDIEATRVMAKSLDALGAPEAEQWRTRLDTLQPGDAGNALARAGGALKNGAVDEAAQILGSLKPEDRNCAAFHAISAGIARKKDDDAKAEAHWSEAMRLEPAEPKHRLGLASTRLASPSEKVRGTALEELHALRGEPAASLEALRLLLSDALRRNELTRLYNQVLRRVDVDPVREAADALVADLRCHFNDKLARASALRKIGDSRSGPYLLDLRDAAMEHPENLYALLAWMNGNNLSMMVCEWGRSFSPEAKSQPPVCKAIADAWVRTGNWDALHEMTASANWGEMDYLRRAFLSRAMEHLGDEEGGAEQWKEACSAATGRADKRVCMEQLARFASQSKWTKRSEEMMWNMAGLAQCPRWVLDFLWKMAFQRGETSRLQRLSGIFVKLDPKGVTSRNNHAFFSLLSRAEEGNPHEDAERLSIENPGNSAIAITRGLSLHQQGKAAEAVAAISSLPAADLQKPPVALYHSIFLIAAGEAAKASEHLPLGEKWTMFPEEKALLDRAKLTATKAADEAGLAEATKAARTARAAREIEGQQAVEAARIARAAKAAQAAEAALAAEAAQTAGAAQTAETGAIQNGNVEGPQPAAPVPVPR